MDGELLLEDSLGDSTSLQRPRADRQGWTFRWATEPPGVAIRARSAPDSNIIVHVGTGQINPGVARLEGILWAASQDRLDAEAASLQRLVQQDAAALIRRTRASTRRLPVRAAVPRGWVTFGEPQGPQLATRTTIDLYVITLEWFDIELDEYVGLIPA